MGITTISAAALLLGVATTALRIRRPHPGQVEEFAAWQVAIGPCRWMLAFRLAGALCALGLLPAEASLSILAWIPAAMGEIADRALFFCAVLPVSVARRAGILPFEPVLVEAPLPRRAAGGKGGA